ncbi:polysaccharide deacetylase family protein [uncultured Clostridium sp.]|uniref:polysaccharide deacetylase family protein n=1 Tax=uncultured Clostridium sp. TaxID=59620 RepID=UPI0028EAED3F|nr:polysaccharide deacetylase family protein [uncultured Clostridium sp.]
MKNKLKCFLFLAINLLLIISIFEQNLSSVSVSSNIKNIEKFNTNEETNNYKKKVIYLTFDDGPSYKITNKVLDILKEKEIKATFFLIGNQIEGKEDTVKRINNDGHSIGLHTYTHKFNCIYCSEDKFIQEMIDCRNEINRVVGISPNIIRFPGGSYKHLNKKYLKKLHDNNLKIYDWNLDNEDGLNPKIPPYKLYRKAINGSKDLPNIILLMHCTDMHKNTCKALPEIIEYYKSQGYEFRTITEDTPEMYFKITKKTFGFFENILTY